MKEINRINLVAVLAAVVSTLISVPVFASSCHDGHSEAAKAKTEISVEKKDTYPLKTCVVSGEELGSMGDYYSYDYEGREVRFCCKMCKKDFLKDPEKYLGKLDKAVVEDGKTESSGHKSTEKKSGGHDHDHDVH